MCVEGWAVCWHGESCLIPSAWGGYLLTRYRRIKRRLSSTCASWRRRRGIGDGSLAKPWEEFLDLRVQVHGSAFCRLYHCLLAFCLAWLFSSQDMARRLVVVDSFPFRLQGVTVGLILHYYVASWQVRDERLWLGKDNGKWDDWALCSSSETSD